VIRDEPLFSMEDWTIFSEPEIFNFFSTKSRKNFVSLVLYVSSARLALPMFFVFFLAQEFLFSNCVAF